MTQLSKITFYLNFISDGTGLKQIDEPIGFDAVDFTVKQDGGRMGRDIFFAGSNKTKYEFNDTVNHYGFQFDRLLEYDRIYGFESEIEFIIKDGDEFFVVGELEFQQKETDHYSKFICNVIVSSTEALIKRRNDVKVDVFSDEDLDGNFITPVETSNILIKAKPILKISKWTSENFNFQRINFGFQSYATFPLFYNIIDSNIKDTLTPFDFSFFGVTGQQSGIIEEQISLSKILRAQEDLNNVKISISNLSFNSGATSLVPVSKRLTINYGDSFVAGQYETIILEENNDDFFNISNNNYEVLIDSIPSGNYLWIRYTMFDPFTSGGATPIGNFSFELLSGELTVTAETISIDTVTKGVRLRDAVKQVSKSINPSFDFTMPRIEEQGTHYNNFIVDGNLLRGREFPLVIPFKDIISHVNNEINLDYEVNENNFFLGNDKDFYPNNEIFVFDSVKPDKTFNVGNNEKYLINEFNFKYKKFNQDKDDDNTIDAVHTEMETLNANRKVENTKKLECDYTRDPFLIATTQRKASSETSTSLSQDDQKFILDCIEIPPDEIGGFTRSMQHNVNNNGQLQILGIGFNWQILGIGNVLNIENTINVGQYTVVSLETNIITLEPNSGVNPQSIQDPIITTVSYEFENVDYVFRTNEGFNLIDGIIAGDNYGNLKYTIKRNILNYWGSYLATASLFKQEDVRVQYFKNNVDLTTQLQSGDVINEIENITQNQLDTPLVTPRLITTKVLCSFKDYRVFQTSLKQINDTSTHIKTKGGFVRVCGNNDEIIKGYVKDSNYSLASGTMDLVLEEKYEDKFTTIDTSQSIYVINEVGYTLDIIPILEYKSVDDYIQFFDANTRPVTKKIRYDFVKINGVVYSSMIDLISAIDTL